METEENAAMERELSITETQAYQDLVDACGEFVPDDAFTLKKFARDANLSESTARKRLKTKVEEGILGSKIAIKDGYRQRVYWFKP